MKFSSLFLCLIIFVCSGCFRINVDSKVPGGRLVEQTEHFFAFGTVGESKVQMAELCPEGVASFGDRFSARDVAYAVASVGVYTPRTVWVQCRSVAPRG